MIIKLQSDEMMVMEMTRGMRVRVKAGAGAGAWVSVLRPGGARRARYKPVVTAWRAVISRQPVQGSQGGLQIIQRTASDTVSSIQ